VLSECGQADYDVDYAERPDEDGVKTHMRFDMPFKYSVRKFVMSFKSTDEYNRIYIAFC